MQLADDFGSFENLAMLDVRDLYHFKKGSPASHKDISKTRWE